MVSLFFFFSLFCIIILLNILIAIINDSYKRTKERSREIFGRAQVEYAAALVARNQFIRVSHIMLDFSGISMYSKPKTLFSQSRAI